MRDHDVTTILELITTALAAMNLPDVVVGFVEKDDLERYTFVVGQKELQVSRDIVASSDDSARAAITTLLEQTLRD